ncbi:MAG: LysM peptidoglycan-binding domain-containing protein [Coriobacteriia bacterium]|nr:LysM peptidoglycan-binding domain-containing protein [Coriobacteriia bacterium]
MKKNMPKNALYPVSGTAALQAEVVPTLVLIEGGMATQGRPESPSRRLGSARCGYSFTVLASALLLIVLAAVLASRGLGARKAVAAQLGAVPTATVRVLEGESLWDIAEEHGVDGVSTKDVVSWIKDRNGLSVSNLSAGQSLLVPAS